ncbi:CCL3 protein, partial [Grantiella picta]|nr:CCL3 protein [Grantiella picta]
AVCCANYISRRIPLRVIHSAYRTSESCAKPAVVLVTNRGRSICVDPKAPWVQEYLEYLELPEH